MKIKGMKTGTVIEIVGEELEQFATIARDNNIKSGRYVKILGLAKGDSKVEEDYVPEGQELFDNIKGYKEANDEEIKNVMAIGDVKGVLEEAKKTVTMLEENVKGLETKILEKQRNMLDYEVKVKNETGIGMDAWIRE